MQAIQQERLNLESRLLQLQGNTAELRRRELEALDPTNRSLQELIWSLEDAQIASQELAAAEQMRTQERMALESRILSTLGLTQVLRERELKTLDASNRELAQRAWELEDAFAGVDSAFATLERSVNRELQTLQAREQAIQETVQTISGMIQQLRWALDTLRGGSSALPAFAQAARDFIRTAAGNARGGAMPDPELLARNLPMALESVNAELFATSFEQERARRLLMLDLAAIAATGEDQLTEAERQLAETRRQTDRLNAILDNARAQIDLLRGVNSSVLSVEAAIGRLGTAITETIRASVVASTISAGGSAADGFEASDAITAAYQSALGRDPDAAGAAWWAGQIASGALTTADLPAALIAEAMANGELPRFATGGSHMGGLRMVGERGPEIEATGPSRIVSHERLMQALTGSAQLGGEVAQMRGDLMAGLRAIEKNTREIKQIEQRWDRIGLPEQRSLV